MAAGRKECEKRTEKQSSKRMLKPLLPEAQMQLGTKTLLQMVIDLCREEWDQVQNRKM